MRDMLVIGAGNYSVALAELAASCGYRIVEFYDDDSTKIGTEVEGIPVVAGVAELLERNLEGIACAVAIGNNVVRRTYLDRLRASGAETPRLIHPNTYVSPSAAIGIGTYVQPTAFIWSKATVCNDCIISPATVIAHHTTIGRGAMVANKAAVGSNVSIGKDVFVGMGATIMAGVSKVEEGSVVGAGAVVINDVPPYSVVVGVPAKVIRTLKSNTH